MRKFVATLAVALCGVFAATAYAALQPGNLNGGGDVPVSLGGTTTSPIVLNITRITMNTGGVTDGEVDPAFYDRNNDFDLRTCAAEGDTGSVNVKYTDGTLATYNIVCAHYSNCRSMSVSYLDLHVDPSGNTYVVFRALNVKPPKKDAVQIGATTSTVLQRLWVNLGFTTGGPRSLGYVFPESTILNGNWTLVPNPNNCTPN